MTAARPTVPLPPAGRTSAYLTDHAGRGPAAVIYLDSWHTIFRFAVGMLDRQTDIARAGQEILVPMREHMTPARFDPMARSLLGDHWYDRLRDRFERSWTCRGCDKDIRVGWKYAPTDDAGSICAACCADHPEYVAKLVRRPAPAPQPATAAV